VRPVGSYTGIPKVVIKGITPKPVIKSKTEEVKAITDKEKIVMDSTG
jgi:hypothetical protein